MKPKHTKPVSVFMLQDHQPEKEPVQWGAYIKDGNNVSISSNCNISFTKKKVDCKAIRKIIYGE